MNTKYPVLLLFLFLCSANTYGQTVVDATEIMNVVREGSEIATYEGTPFTGIITSNYPNGKPRSWVKYNDGLPDGLWQEWYETGLLKFNAYWTSGKGHGLWEYYHENGVLRQEEYYNMDVPIGIFRDFYNNGQLKSKSCWLNGRKQGVWTYYDETGVLLKTEIYADDKLVSTTDE